MGSVGMGVVGTVFAEGVLAIWGACGWHTAWNWTMGNLFGLNISGHEPTGGTLFNLKPIGTSLLSGGGYGPEGSLFGTLVFLAAIAVVVFVKRDAKGTSGFVSQTKAGISP